MALQAAYRQFLAAPSSSSLAPNAALYYITTTTTVHGATEIIKHLGTMRKQVRNKKEEILSAIESKNGLAVEVDTTLEFLTSGGAYLPAMDDNFVADRVVHLAITHFVTFDADGKIAQVRQSWDQGALLKQVDVIGRSGRNWPIRESTEQIKLITSASHATGDITTAATAPPSEGSLRSRGNSVKRDPHASLELFPSREELEGQSTAASVVLPYGGVRPRQRDITEILNTEPSSADATPRAVISPYGGRRPRQRSFTEILGNEEYEGPDGSPSRGRSQSPSKAIAPKAGSHMNFQPVRLFDADMAAAAAVEANSSNVTKPSERFYRPNPKRFDHFDLADGSEEQHAPKAGKSIDALPKTKRDSHWGFEDFVTPQKPAARLRTQEVRHWNVNNDDVPDTPSAASRRQAPVRPRRDAEMHFEFKDDGEPSGEPHVVTRQRGTAHNNGLSLYENNLYKEDGQPPTPEQSRALGNITNLKDRSKVFDSHFVVDGAASPTTANNNGKSSKVAPISDDRKKAVQMMESSWATDVANKDNDASSQKENNLPGTSIVVGKVDSRGIITAGDGMGNKKGGRSWSFGEDSDEAERPALAAAVPGKKQGTGNQASSFWDF